MTCRLDDDRLAVFDMGVKRRGRGRWKWLVRTTEGHVIMCGSEWTRSSARYKAQRALLLLLCASVPRLSEFPQEKLDRGARHPPGRSGTIS
jgi:hypothetical protein